MNCERCCSNCIKAGKQANGKQRYYCKTCKRHLQQSYEYKACTFEVHRQFSRLNKSGMGSLKLARFLEVSVNTLKNWLLRTESLRPPLDIGSGGVFDIDELQTYVGNRSNKIWITYSLEVASKNCCSLEIGRRTSEVLGEVVRKVILLNPKQINTDNYVAYLNLIQPITHNRGKRKANHIEREHRNIRKDIANLIQETMCFAKSERLLLARLKWYFWGDSDPYFFLRKA
jgi:insertion element IS1 protein InsB